MDYGVVASTPSKATSRTSVPRNLKDPSSGPAGETSVAPDPSSSPGEVLEATEPRMMTPHRSIFEGIAVMKQYPVYDEFIHASLERYHEPWDQWEDEDPLAPFGAVNGLLPNRPAAEAIALRALVMRWTSPEKDCHWSSLQEAVDNMCQVSLRIEDMVPFPYLNKIKYSLHARLDAYARIVLALTQILGLFADYFFSTNSQSFVVDKDFELIRSLAWNDNREIMVAAFIILQRRCSVAVVQIRRNFNKLVRVLLARDETLSAASYNSTTPSERDRMAFASPRSSFKAFLMREDFASDFAGKNETLRNNVVNSLKTTQDTFRETPYV